MSTTPTTPYSYSTLPNGLRSIAQPRKAEVEYFGVAVNAGSRDESDAQAGLAHFVEHTIFKGTARRRPWHIINRMESVGGELNAYTTKEETVVYTAFPRGALGRAIELVADLVKSSVFPAKEIDREREVVTDEINSYLDTPADAIFDDFDERAFAGSSMAHNILGTAANIAAFTPQTCRQWLDSRYTPSTMVAFYSGPSPRRFEALVQSHFGDMDHAPVAPARVAPAECARFVETVDKGLHQSHTVAGLRIPPIDSPLAYPLALAVNILGGPGMNSLLNLEMREKRGLVYSVEATTATYSDCGLMNVYYGCDREDTHRCADILATTLERLPLIVTPRRLQAAKRQFTGQLALARQNSENTITAAARRTLLVGSALTPREIAARIEAITPDAFALACALLRPERLSSLTFT